MKHTKKVPLLRFSEFEGDWENKKIKQLLVIGSGRDYKHLGGGDIPVFGTGGLMHPLIHKFKNRLGYQILIVEP